MASNSNYGQQYNILFGFLLLIAVSLFVTVWRGGPSWLHVAGGIATVLTFFLWFWQWGREWYGPDSWPPQPEPHLTMLVSVWLIFFILLYLVRTTPFAALLFFVFIGLALRQPEDGTAWMLGALVGTLFVLIQRRKPILGAIAIGLCAIAIIVRNPLSPLYLIQVSHSLAPPPMPWPILLTFVILFAALFILASMLDVPLLAILAVPFYAAMLITSNAPTAGWQLAFAIVPYALFVLYAFFPGARARATLAPYVALVMASVIFLASATVTIRSAGGITGLVPLIEAAVFLVLLWWTARIEPVEPRSSMLVNSVFAFFAVALILLLPMVWILIALALETALLSWLFARFAYRGFLGWSVSLAIALFVWITFDAALYTRVGTYALLAGFAVALCAVAMFVAAWFAPGAMTRIQLLFSLAGLIESWYLVNIIIANVYHSTGVALNIEFMNFVPREDVTYTIAWSLIATGLLFIGFHWDWQGARVGATGLLILAVLKCFLHDLVRRGDPYRVPSLVGVAVSLLVVAVVLQRYTRSRVSSPSMP
jgi:hypothetical protein